MSSVSTSVREGIGHRARVLVLGLAVACLGALAFTGSANAAPMAFSTSFDSGEMDLGAGFAETKILPASNRIGDPLPLTPNLPNVWGGGANQPSLNLQGSYDPDTGDIAIPPGGFQSPIMQMINPTDGSAIPIMLQSQTPNTANFSAMAPVTGHLDEATGEMNLEGTWSIQILVALGMGNVTSTCEIPLPDLKLSTNNSQSFTGTPYENGLPGKGAVTGDFTIVDPVIGHALPPNACDTLNTGVAGAGGIWLAYGQADPTPFPVCPEGTEGIPPNCTPIPPPVEPGKVKKVVLKLKNKKLKAGKSTKMNVIVYNDGGENLTAKVNLKGNNGNVKIAKKKVTVKNIAPGKNKQVKVKITAKKNKKGKKTQITGKSGGKTGRLQVKIK